jgi:hypothetical protein
VQASCLAVQCLYSLGSVDDFKREAAAFLVQQPAPTPDQQGAIKYYLAQIPYNQGEWAAAETALKGFVASESGSPTIGFVRYQLCDALLRQAKYDQFTA